MMTEKLPPHDIDAEEAVIGSLLVGGSMNGLQLDAEDFYHEPTRWLYSCCQSLGERGVSIDQITLGNELNAAGKLEACGGVAFLSHLISVVPTHMDLHHYAEIVRRLSLSRMIMVAGQQIATIGHKAGPDVAEAMDRADNILLQVRRHGIASPVVTPEERASLLSDRYEELFGRQGGIATKTGLTDLDYRLGGGLYNGDLVVLGARPGMGKTTVLQNMANHIGKDKNVLFCSAEMGIEGVSDRDVAGIIGVPIGDVRLGGYSDDLYAEITGPALEKISKLKVYYYKEMPMTSAKITQVAMGMSLREGLAAVFVDYLGALDDEYGDNQHLRLGYITRKLKQAARICDVPFVVAHQLNRELEKRADKRPQLFDLRESGNIEENADNVLFLYRESYYSDEPPEQRSPVTEILIAKLRQGGGHRFVEVYYDEKHQLYRDLNREQEGMWR